MRTLFQRLISTFALAGAAMLLPAAAQAQSTPYVTLERPHQTDSGDKIEVLEFFSYTCGHCAALAPLLDTWTKNQPDDVAVVHVPIAFNAGMRPLQQLYYTLEAMGRTDLHLGVFRAIHEQRTRMFDEAGITKWATETAGLDPKVFADTYNSFGVHSRMQRANQLAESYAIDSTPQVVVDGRFLTSPALANGYAQTVTQTDALVKQIRATR
ncbi:thiol:disulfide interchange protein DsbA/DsbL [Alcaligenaceae bacterium SJ-26]|nr:thiol:disulfide interchange protein DsbA/DsbL [Alcaligenaceae bacterium SJ-26]